MLNSFKPRVSILIISSVVISASSAANVKRMNQCVDIPEPSVIENEHPNLVTSFHNLFKRYGKRMVSLCLGCFSKTREERVERAEQPSEQKLNVKFGSTKPEQKQPHSSTSSLHVESNDSFGKGLPIPNNSPEIDLSSIDVGNHGTSFVQSPLSNAFKGCSSEFSVLSFGNTDDYSFDALRCYVSQQKALLNSYYESTKEEIQKEKYSSNVSSLVLKCIEQRIIQASTFEANLMLRIKAEKEFRGEINKFDILNTNNNQKITTKTSKALEESLEYDYYVESINISEKDLRQKKMHGKSLISILNKFKSKQDDSLKGQFNCNENNDYLGVIMNLSMELIDLKKDIDETKICLGEYKGKIKEFKQFKDRNKYMNNINIKINLNGNKLSKFNRRKDSPKTYTDFRPELKTKHKNDQSLRESVKRSTNYNQDKKKNRYIKSAIINRSDLE